MFLFLISLLFASPAWAAEESFLDQAAFAVEKHDKGLAEFWLTRRVATDPAFAVDAQTEALLKRLRYEPKGFIPDSWPERVRRWFLERPRAMWTPDSSRIHENDKRFEAVSASDGIYFATLTVVPEFQLWYRLENGLSTSREWIIAGAAKPPPILAFGPMKPKTGKSQPSCLVRLFSFRALHHADAPQFRDLDGDGAPELVLRLTWLVSNGFRQTIRIYRIRTGGQLELWKTFDSPTGSFARLEEDGSPQLLKAEDVTESFWDVTIL